MLFAACVVMFALAGSIRLSTDTLLAFGASSRSLVWSGEYWRLFTSMFVHIGVVHLVVNLWFGFSWAAPMEKMLGSARFLLVYLASGLAGSALSVIGHDVVAAGASGALSGLIGATLVAFRAHLGSWSKLWANPPLRRTIITAIIWLVIGPFIRFDSFAHVGGLLAGGAITWALISRSTRRLVTALVCTAILIAVSLHPIPEIHEAAETTKRSAE